MDVRVRLRMASRSSRARGLKLNRFPYRDQCLLVALFTGAWIETMSIDTPKLGLAVALFTGAWIETLDQKAK